MYTYTYTYFFKGESVSYDLHLQTTKSPTLPTKSTLVVQGDWPYLRVPQHEDAWTVSELPEDGWKILSCFFSYTQKHYDLFNGFRKRGNLPKTIGSLGGGCNR